MIELTEENILSCCFIPNSLRDIKQLGGYKLTGVSVLCPFTEFKKMLKKSSEVRNVLLIEPLPYVDNSNLKILFLNQVILNQLLELKHSILTGSESNYYFTSDSREGLSLEDIRRLNTLHKFSVKGKKQARYYSSIYPNSTVNFDIDEEKLSERGKTIYKDAILWLGFITYLKELSVKNNTVIDFYKLPLNIKEVRK